MCLIFYDPCGAKAKDTRPFFVVLLVFRPTRRPSLLFFVFVSNFGGPHKSAHHLPSRRALGCIVKSQKQQQQQQQQHKVNYNEAKVDAKQIERKKTNTQNKTTPKKILTQNTNKNKTKTKETSKSRRKVSFFCGAFFWAADLWTITKTPKEILAQQLRVFVPLLTRWGKNNAASWA